MFVNFLYTECNSAGPFKKEPGFKFKSVAFHPSPSEGLSVVGSIEAKLDAITGSFLPFEAPTISPFMSQQDFERLDKVWSLQETRAGNFVFTRQFTSGVSHGRPDNPFHQGFIFTTDDIDWIVRSTEELSGMEFARPADFTSWGDWLTPRGDDQLEAASFDQGNPPLPGINSVEWGQRIEELHFSDIDRSTSIISGFETAIRQGSNFGVHADTDLEFLNWVSFLTHLLPLIKGWQTRFTSTNAGSNFPSAIDQICIYRQQELNVSSTQSNWTRIVQLILESGLVIELDRAVGLVSRAYEFSSPGRSSALDALLIAACSLDSSLFEDHLASEVASCLDLVVGGINQPGKVLDFQAAERILDLFEKQESLLRRTQSGERLHMHLSKQLSEIGSGI